MPCGTWGSGEFQSLSIEKIPFENVVVRCSSWVDILIIFNPLNQAPLWSKRSNSNKSLAMLRYPARPFACAVTRNTETISRVGRSAHLRDRHTRARAKAEGPRLDVDLECHTHWRASHRTAAGQYALWASNMSVFLITQACSAPNAPSAFEQSCVAGGCIATNFWSSCQLGVGAAECSLRSRDPFDSDRPTDADRVHLACMPAPSVSSAAACTDGEGRWLASINGKTQRKLRCRASA